MSLAEFEQQTHLQAIIRNALKDGTSEKLGTSGMSGNQWNGVELGNKVGIKRNHSEQMGTKWKSVRISENQLGAGGKKRGSLKKIKEHLRTKRIKSGQVRPSGNKQKQNRNQCKQVGPKWGFRFFYSMQCKLIGIISFFKHG